ncbi:hypothetical protein ABZ477_00310 [Microbacterium sp. NPDC019599]|uniref:hypothetical protein n=1 Tax=Microbacterium sp. NPDC019599 TaxID=3154690 RepID=UPI0033E86BA4
MRRTLVIGLVIVAAAAVAAGTVWWLFSRPPGPDATAQAFLDALEEGDGVAALALTEEPPGPDVDRAEALAGAEEHIAEATVEAVDSVEGGAARATVTFTLDGEEQTASFGLVEREGAWTVAADAFGLMAATTTIGDSVSAGGVVMPAGEDVALLPAAYVVAASPAGIVAGSASAMVLPGGTSEAAIEASVSPEAVDLAQEQLDAYAAACAAPGDAVPAHCGLKVPWGADLATLDAIAFRIGALPQVALASDLTSFAATAGDVVATATGITREGATASFTYRADDWALRGTVILTPEGMRLQVD